MSRQVREGLASRIGTQPLAGPQRSAVTGVHWRRGTHAAEAGGNSSYVAGSGNFLPEALDCVFVQADHFGQ